MKDTLTRINHSVWELNKLLSKDPSSYMRRAQFIEFFHESRVFVERKRGVPEGDRSFLLLQDRDALCCLLLHGAGGTPAEMRALGEHLFKTGYSVYGMRLCLDGDAASSSRTSSSGGRLRWAGFKKRRKRTKPQPGCNWEKCLVEAEVVLSALLSFSSNTYVVGFSFGGTVALNLLQKFPLKGGVLIAPALFPVQDGRYLAFKVVRTVAPFAAKGITPREYNLLEFLKSTRASLKEVKQPILVIHGAREKIVSSKGFHYIKGLAKHPKSRFELLNSDRHVLVKGEDAETVFRLCTDFLRQS
jgi:esterase/lipase